MRRYFIDKIENMRDIGGYSIDYDRVVKEGKIIRSNCVINLSNEDLEKLIKMKFTTIIDLRNDEEIQKEKGIFYNNQNFKYNHIKINGDGKIPDRKEDVLNSYIEMLNGKKQIKDIFEILNKADDGVIYYCNAGKDRTGVITVCILKLLGVDNQDIIVDYLASGVFLKEMLERYSESVQGRDIFSIINPNYDTIYNLLKYIDNQYGSIEQYLNSCNISNETLQEIKNKYICEKRR